MIILQSRVADVRMIKEKPPSAALRLVERVEQYEMTPILSYRFKREQYPIVKIE